MDDRWSMSGITTLRSGFPVTLWNVPIRRLLGTCRMRAWRTLRDPAATPDAEVCVLGWRTDV